MNYPINNAGHPTPGLRFTPTLEPGYSDTNHDFPKYLHLRGGEHDNSENVLRIIRDLVTEHKPMRILEIGVALYDPQHSITHQILHHKPVGSVYLGVDIGNKSSLDSPENSVYTIECDSMEQVKVRNELLRNGIEALDLLIIDGNHSVKNATNDWLYSDLIVAGGHVIIHDVASHPGPYCLAAAIDRDLYDVEEPLKNHVDYGVAIVTKRGVKRP